MIGSEMLFYELDYRVWNFRYKWTFEDPCPEVVSTLTFFHYYYRIYPVFFFKFISCEFFLTRLFVNFVTLEL